MNKLLFFDTETTGKDFEDRLIQICYSIPTKDFLVTGLFKPSVPIKFEAMATHHITQEEVDATEFFAGSQIFRDLEENLATQYIFVAHNAKFDVQMLKNEGITVIKYIDTLKVTQSLFPDESMYKLQYLRYKFGLKVTADARSHNAEGDVLVLQELFNYLCATHEAKETATGNHDYNFESCIKWMLKISQEPSLLKRIPFGKHKGKTFEDLCKEDKKYLEWLSDQKELSEDLKHTLDYWLKPKTKN